MKELTREELERMYDEMVAQGLGQAALDGFRRSHGLPMPERPAPAIVIRTASAPARRPRTRRKSSAQKASAPTAATSKSRVQTRFDLKD
jgi:hypothetical protein